MRERIKMKGRNNFELKDKIHFNNQKIVRVISSVFILLFLTTPTLFAQLQGDEKAISMVDRMLETLGGKSVWAKAAAIKVELNGYYAREQEPWYEKFWMELDNPRGRFELKNETIDRVIAWTPEGGWEFENGKAEVMENNMHTFEMKYWKRQPVVVFHRLALNKPDTRVEMGDNEFRFDVFDNESNELIAQFAVNMKGEPIKWGSKINDREFEHIFGVLQNYENVIMPRWGASISGVWRYEHLEVSLSEDLPAVSYEMPEGD